jgi:hypothetical protein
MQEDFSQLMSSDPTNALRYVKLKYGIAELEDSAEVIDTRTYFITTVSPTTLSYVKELIRIFSLTEKEKSLKSVLVVLGSQKAVMSAGDVKTFEGVVFAEPKEVKEKALLLYGSIAYISLLHEVECEPFYLEIMKLGVPLVLPHLDNIDSVIGHAAFFLEKINEEHVQAALLKLESSKTLRESIVKSALEQIKNQKEGS